MGIFMHFFVLLELGKYSLNLSGGRSIILGIATPF